MQQSDAAPYCDDKTSATSSNLVFPASPDSVGLKQTGHF